MLQERILNLKERVIQLASVVEEMLKNALMSIDNEDHLLARNIITNIEPIVNRMETENESSCIEFLALYQPEAVDLRTIISLLKINNAVERIADHIVNIVQRMESFNSKKFFRILDDMFERAQSMFRESIDSLTGSDIEKAKMVIAMDEQMDRDLRKLTEDVMLYLSNKPRLTKNGISALLIGRDLERIADIATNISEDTLYLIQGEVIKRQAM